MDAILQARIHRCVRYMVRHGYSVIPLGADKRPAWKWGEFIGKPMSAEQFPDNCNIALITGAETGIVVIDCDTINDANLWAGKPDTETPFVVRTRRGAHFYYRHPGSGKYVKSGTKMKDANGAMYDVKGDRSYVQFPPSMASGHQYHVVWSALNPSASIVDFQLLPLFRPEWRPETPAGGRLAAVKSGGLTDAMAYILRIRAVSGERGHDTTYRAVCRLKESGMSESEAVAGMCEWNQTNSDPPWSVREILHKVKAVYKSS